jgi:hypothetical protein
MLYVGVHMTTLGARLLSGNRIRAVQDGGTVVIVLSEEADSTPCKCCAPDCETTVAVAVSFCGMSINLTVPIPGSASGNTAKPEPDQSFLNVDASIACGTCGWLLTITVCGYCEETNIFASDGFYATIPFSDTAEPGSNECCYCPTVGAVDLCCFGEQFGIPCVTTATAEVE